MEYGLAAIKVSYSNTLVHVVGSVSVVDDSLHRAMSRREGLVFWRARPGVSFQSSGAAHVDSAKPLANLPSPFHSCAVPVLFCH